MADAKIIGALDNAGIKYELYEHPAFTTCEVSSAWHKDSGRPGQRVKNLFLRNKKGDQHFLLLLPHALEYDKKIFKALSGQKCGFADDTRLWEHLKIKPGAVSPLSLVHDENHQVQVFIEQSLVEAQALHLHPGTPEASVQIAPNDLLTWLQNLGYQPQTVAWTEPTPVD